jgi:hypothetical protein
MAKGASGMKGPRKGGTPGGVGVKGGKNMPFMNPKSSKGQGKEPKGC